MTEIFAVGLLLMYLFWLSAAFCFCICRNLLLYLFYIFVYIFEFELFPPQSTSWLICLLLKEVGAERQYTVVVGDLITEQALRSSSDLQAEFKLHQYW